MIFVCDLQQCKDSSNNCMKVVFICKNLQQLKWKLSNL